MSAFPTQEAVALLMLVSLLAYVYGEGMLNGRPAIGAPRPPCAENVSASAIAEVETDPARWIEPFMRRLTERERATFNLLLRVTGAASAAAEREACAQIADREGGSLLSFGHRLTAEIIASKIRQRAAARAEGAPAAPEKPAC